MSLLKEISPDEATGKTSEIYGMLKQAIGFVPNALKLYSASPALFEMQAGSMGYYMPHKTISSNLTAFIRLLVSKSHACKYCINVNTAILMQAGVKIEDITAAQDDIAKAPLEDKEKQMLILVMKVIENSNSVTADDLKTVRDLGWSDGDILDAVNHGTSQVGSDMIINAFKVEDDVMEL